MAIANLIVQVRTAGANQLRNLSSGFRQAGRAGSQASAEIRRDFDRAVVAMSRANGELAEMRREFNRAPSQELARRMHMAALAARQASNNVDNLADQLRQANRQATSLAGRLGAVAAASSALSTVGSGSPWMSGLIAGIVGLAPVIATALQGALIVGLGGAGLGAAIAAAFQNADIKKVWTDLLGGIGSDLKKFGAELGPALAESADMFRIAWARASGSVRGLFGDLGSTIIPLSRGLLGMLREAGPGLKKAFASAVPALKELAAMLPGLGKAMSSFFSSISDEESTLKGVRLIVMSLAGSLVILGKTIQFLSAWFSTWASIAEKVYSVLGKIPGLGVPFKFFADTLHGINEPTEAFAEAVESTARPMEATRAAATGMSVELLRTADASKRAAAALLELTNQMSAMIDKNMSVQQAAIAYEAAIDAVTASFKENGKSIDIANAKGRENVETVLQAVAAANQKRQAAIDLAGGENASADAVAAANAEFNRQIGQLAGVLRQAGLSEDMIRQLLGTYQSLANQGNIYKTITVERKLLGPQLGGVYGYRGLATGTTAAPRGAAIVGEEGPELVTFRGGERVYDAGETSRILSRRRGRGGGESDSGGGSSGGVTLVYNGGGGADSLVYRWLNESIRTGRLKVA